LKNRLAVNMLVLNGATVLRRCLVPLKGIIDELVVVDSGSTDDTQNVLENLASEMKLDRFYYERIHPYSQCFVTDEAETWKMEIPGPFTGGRLLKDWAAARNRALDHTHADYVLKLDADDEPISPPENWLRTVDHLDANSKLSFVAAPYEVFDGRGKISWLSMYDRLWRRVPTGGGTPVRWDMVCHEYLTGKTSANTLCTVQGLRVRDWRDSPGVGVRIPHRNLKVLLWDHENNHHPGDSHSEATRLFTLAHEAAEIFPMFAIDLLETVTSMIGEDMGMLSDCFYHHARAEEALGNVGSAIALYEKADVISPHVQALLREYAMIVRAGKQDGEHPKEDLRPEGQRPEVATSPRLCRLREKILARVGADPAGPVPFNCDLKLVAMVRENS